MPRNHWRKLIGCLLFLPLLARADAVSPPVAFWEYMDEFADQNGDLLDPLELKEAQQLVQQATTNSTHAETADSKDNAMNTSLDTTTKTHLQEESKP